MGMLSLPVHSLLASLRDNRNRTIFHSEADFQHALAWELRLMYPSSQLRLEVHAPSLEKRLTKRRRKVPKMCIDIFAKQEGGAFGLELKYRSIKTTLRIDDEVFDLKNHSARPQGRYQFLRDIQRLEIFVAHKWIARGYALFLTNDSQYWRRGKAAENCYDREFLIYENKTIGGLLRWDRRASHGTKKGMERPISLAATYKLNWRDYTPSENAGSCFRYLAVEVICGTKR